MKIPQQFPQFKKERALLILTGTQEGEYYLAGEGSLEKIEMFRVPKIKYSDRGAIAMRTGKTGVSGGGSNSTKEQYQQEFVAKLKTSVKDVIARTIPTQIIVISPVLAEVESLLPVASKKLVTMRIKKNLCEKHFDEILGHIQKELSK